MPYIEVKGRSAVLLAALSVAMAVSPAVLAVRALDSAVWVELVEGVDLPWSSDFYLFASLAVAALAAPYAAISHVNRRYVEAIERSLPAFFEGLEEGVRAGMPLVRALETAAKAVGGPLAREMLAVVARVEMGDTLEGALEGLVKRIPAPALKRAASLVLVAYQSGGRVGEVLGAAAEMYGMLRSYEEERRATMSPYTATVYVALAVFLVVASVLLAVFITPLERISGYAAQLLTPLPSPLFKAVFFFAAAVQAVAGGLVAGKISRGTVKAGLPQAIIMLVLVAFYFYMLEKFIEPKFLLAPGS
jgi:pilus assembly protein TadC